MINYVSRASAAGTVLLAQDGGAVNRQDPESCIAMAMEILGQRITTSPCMSNPDSVSKYLMLHAHQKSHECFWVLFLNADLRLISLEEMFRGTVSQTSVYPREIVKRSLEVNAWAVVFAHNHLSGNLQPSRADERLTKTLKEALELVDIKVLDHLIVSCNGWKSMADAGML